MFTNVRESLQQWFGLFSENEQWELQRRIKRELSSSEDGIELANKKCHVMLLPATAPVAMMIVNEEDFVVEVVDGSGVRMSFAAKEACEALKLAVKLFAWSTTFSSRSSWRPWSKLVRTFLREFSL